MKISLLQGSAYTEPTMFQLLTALPAKRLGQHKKLGGDTARAPRLDRGMSHTVWHCAQP